MKFAALVVFSLQSKSSALFQITYGLFTLPDKETDTKTDKMDCIEFTIIFVGVDFCVGVGVGVGQCERTITYCVMLLITACFLGPCFT